MTPTQPSIFTLVSYRPNYNRYLGGGSYKRGDDSDFELAVFTDEAALVQQWAQQLFYARQPQDGSRREPPVLTLLLDGHTPDSESEFEYSDPPELERLARHRDLRVRIQEQVDAALDALEAPARRRALQLQEAAARAAAQAKEAAAAAAEQAERAQLRELLGKYGAHQ